MQGPEKRRGGSHVLRTGPARASSRLSGSVGLTARGAGPPTSPPRAAVTTVKNKSETKADGGAPDDAADDDSSHDDHDPPRDKGRDADGVGVGDDHNKKQQQQQQQDTSLDDSQAPLLLRQRDERIARLEADMDSMERDFRRELDQLSQNESETASFWQAKHSALNRQFLDSDTELRLLRADAERRTADHADLLRACDALRRVARDREDEVRALRAQVRGLKDWVSTSTRSDGQTSDEVFADAMAKLANGLQNWVIVNFRKARLDLSLADDATLAELADLVPMYADLVSTAKIHMLQSVVSRILVDSVFNAYFVGFSDDEMTHFRKMESLLCSFAASDEAVNQWRSSTLALVRREAPRLLQAETGALVDAVVARINRLLDAVTTTTPAPASDARDAALRLLVDSAVDLARLLVVQRAVLRVHLPALADAPFDPATMDDVGGLDEDALAGSHVACAVFPGLIKHGDESGGQMQFRNVIVKTRVLCSGPGD